MLFFYPNSFVIRIFCINLHHITNSKQMKRHFFRYLMVAAALAVGMSVTVSPEDADRALDILKANGEDAYIIGRIEESNEKIKLV